MLEDNPTDHLPFKKIIAKRLSQCLNENLPIGIHRTTLNLYTIILINLQNNNQLMSQQIYLYSFGIFPFFSKCSLQVKPLILDIYKAFYLPLGLNLIPMLTGIIGSVIGGIEEQDVTVQTQIFSFLTEINEIVGDLFYVSSLW